MQQPASISSQDGISFLHSGTTSSLIGREREMREISTLFLRSDMRILTLTGTGGVGKTRLALQVATALGPTFADSVCFVPLAPVSDPAQVIPTLARALGLRETFDSSPQEQVQEYLHNRHILLLLDNFEQVVTAAPVLGELLASCAALRLLVTSRVKLNLPAEQLFPVDPLALPAIASLPDNETLTKIASVALFLQRARTAQPGFELTQANAHVVAAICSYLDGLPLAIELAAARINLLPPQALLKRLQNRLAILTSNTESRPSRHQTLRNTIQWSYDLLNSDEQCLFRRLSIFIAGFPLQAVEALSLQLDGSSAIVLDTLTSLIEKNLLRSPQKDEEDPRLEMLETIRAFALELLQASGEYDAVKHAHMQHFLSLAEEAASFIPGPQEAAWKQRLDDDIANLRTVMQWSLHTGEHTHNMETALRLGGALKNYWISCGYLREGKTFLEQAVAGCEGPMTSLQARATLAIVKFALLFCDYQPVPPLLQACQTYYQEQNDVAQVASITLQLGWLATLQFRLPQAHIFYEQALTLSRELHDEEMINLVRYHRAFLALTEGNYQQSQVLLEEGLLYQKTHALYRDIASTLGDMAQLLRLSSVIPPVEKMYGLLNEAMHYAKEAGNQNLIMALHYGMAWVAFLRGNLDEAHQMVDETIAFYQEAGKLQSLGHYLELRGRIYSAQGKYIEARATLEESIVQARKQNDIDTLASDIVELAYLAVEQSQYARATRLLGIDELMRAPAHLPTHPFDSLHRDHVITIARTVLGRELFDLLWTEGRALSPLDALTVNDDFSIKPRSTHARTLAYPAGLTRREVDVLHLVAQGFTDSQVAAQLVISTRTVTTHLTSIYNKLQINSRSAATNFAVKNHLA